ncbi:hypothetical protein JXA05_04555 [Candidatus Peregrinibacteria bacterium]|nr:hypothetical protein [Candidatus Peregrinibacteria bacterium]
MLPQLNQKSRTIQLFTVPMAVSNGLATAVAGVRETRMAATKAATRMIVLLPFMAFSFVFVIVQQPNPHPDFSGGGFGC